MSHLDRSNRVSGRHPLDDLAAYALDAVDDHERGEIEAHLTACPSCRQELAVHEEVLSRMIGDESPPPRSGTASANRPWALPGPAPEPAPGDACAEGGPAAAPPRGRARRGAAPSPGRGLAAAAAVVVAVGVGRRCGTGSPATTARRPPRSLHPTCRSVITAADGTEVARVGADARGSYVEMMDPTASCPSTALTSCGRSTAPIPCRSACWGQGLSGWRACPSQRGTTSVAISDEPAGGSLAPSGLIAGSGDLAVPA